MAEPISWQHLLFWYTEKLAISRMVLVLLLVLLLLLLLSWLYLAYTQN